MIFETLRCSAMKALQNTTTHTDPNPSKTVVHRTFIMLLSVLRGKASLRRMPQARLCLGLNKPGAHPAPDLAKSTLTSQLRPVYISAFMIAEETTCHSHHTKRAVAWSREQRTQRPHTLRKRQRKEVECSCRYRSLARSRLETLAN